MYQYHCLNAISSVGLEVFDENYTKVDDMKDADAVLVRSAAMHDMDFDKNLKVIARAGAGVNNIPIDKCSDKMCRSWYCRIQYTRCKCQCSKRAGCCRNVSCIP